MIRIPARLTVLLKALLPPPQRRKHKEDRFRALVGLFHTFALSAWGLGIITPLFTADTHFNIGRAAVSLAVGLGLEAMSLTLLSYIPYPEDLKEEQDDG